MACPGEGILTDLARRLVDKTIKEANYFRHFETHVHKFEQDRKLLIRRLEKVQNDIVDAKINENQVEGEVQDWIDEAVNLIQKNAEIKQRGSCGWCPYWQYRQGKGMVKRMLAIKDHIQKCDFEKVARPVELPGIKYHVSKDFIDFKSRNTGFKQLVEALEGENHYMIGLQGMGGTGKTTLATQVGKQLEESKACEKVIFVSVSNPPDVVRIRGDIARQLGLHLEEREETEHSKLLWSRISNNERKLLIILDDVWGELNLTDIGIPSGLDHKSCYVLITTRHTKVCQAMRCQQIVHLNTLTDEDALTLFLFHATCDDDDHHHSSNDLEGLAPGFVKECGGLPIAIIALARTLRNWPVGEWNAALTTLRNSKPFVDVDEDLVEVYRCLRLSYDNLNNERAQKLFLLCSIFPKDFEIPVNLIVRLGIGSGIFGEVDKYCAVRSQALAMKNKLIASSLLLEVNEKECVKMHDMVREVAQWIAKEDIQVILDSRTTLEANKLFVFWIIDDFPVQFDGTKLEILLILVRGNGSVKGQEAFFARMTRLKVLFLLGKYDRTLIIPSLSQSLLSLKNMSTLILENWKLGDISVLKNLQSLVALELKNCLIIELPKDIVELKKLRLLELRMCEIQKNNPFEVIETCSQLEELYFVGNYNVKNWKPEDDKEIEDEIAHDISPSALQMFSIACSGFECFANDDNDLLKCFNTKHMTHLISKAMFKYLVGRAQVLELREIGESAGLKSLVPDIVPVEDGGMDNLIKLYLHEWANIEYLIDTSKHCYSNMAVFSKLVEMHLYGVDVKEFYWGAMPFGFLRQLQILKLKKCLKLQNIFLDKNLKLPHLKVLELIDCPMFQPSIFQSSIARSLAQLEELVIDGCQEIKSLIAYESLEEEIMLVSGDQKKYDLLFPELKSLQIRRCGKLEMLSSLLLAGDLHKLKDLYIDDCEEIKYIFGEYRDVGQVLQHEITLPSLTEVQLYDVPGFINIFKKCNRRVLKEDSEEKHENFKKTRAFSWAHGCCFLAPTEDTNIRVSNATLKHYTISQESCASSKKIIERFHTAECLMRQPLSLQNIRQMRLWGCSKLKSLFSVSIVTTIMLEQLTIRDCEELKHIITTEEDDDDHLNNNSIFPKLQRLQIITCKKLESIFPSTISGGFQKLKSIKIFNVDKLKYVFGKYEDEQCLSNENENNELRIHLPALEILSLQEAPNLISIAIKKYQLECPSLQAMETPKEMKKHMQDMTNEGAKQSEIQEIVNVETPSIPSVGFQYVLNFHNLQEIEISGNKKLKTLFSISTCRNLPQLSKLRIENCRELINVVEEGCKDYCDGSIFPNLEDLKIRGCNKLEFIFPFSLFGSLQNLKSLSITEAAELKCIFGKYHHGDYSSNENESDELHIIHLPALETLSFVGAPKMINNICAAKYHLSFPSLESIRLRDLQELNIRSFLDLMAYLQGVQLNVKASKDLMKVIKDVQKLTNIEVINFKIEEVLNLEGMEIGGLVMTLSLEKMWLANLSELKHIYKGSKYILSFHNLQNLDIIACRKLKAIFCVSIMKNFPQLSYLNVEDCDGLVDIVEENAEDHLNQLCFPKLEEIHIKHCNSLKSLFSISTCNMFPKLWRLEIEQTSELEQVFIRNQNDNTQEMSIMEEVFPKLSYVTLTKLSKLITICEGIDFKTLKRCKVDDCPKYQETSQIKKEPKIGDSENQTTSNALSDFMESSKEARMTSVEEVASSMITGEILIEAQAKDPTLASKKHASETSATKSQLRKTCLQSIEAAGLQSDSSALELEDEESTCETISLGQLQDHGETKKSIEVAHKTKIPFDDDSIEVIVKERVQESSSSKDVILENLYAGLAPDNLSAASITTLQEEFPLDLTKKESRIGTIMTNQQALTEKRVGNIQEQTTTMKDKIDTPFSYPQAYDSQSSPSTLRVESVQEETTAMEDKIDTCSFYSHVEGSKSSSSTMTTKETKDANVEDGPESEKAEMANLLTYSRGFNHNIPMEDNTNLGDVIPSFHHQSQTVAAGSSSPILEIGEIFQLVELKEGEAALLAKALELYPQLKLSRGKRNHPIIAFSYRVLVDILVMLATKTRYTITASDRITLEANLNAATFLGFDKDWIELVRAKVFVIDQSNVLVAEEKISVMEGELEKCDIALEHMQKKRMKAKEKLAKVQDEFEEVDNQLFDLLEDRRKLVMKMAEFRKIMSAKDRPFGI